MLGSVETGNRSLPPVSRQSLPRPNDRVRTPRSRPARLHEAGLRSVPSFDSPAPLGGLRLRLRPQRLRSLGVFRCRKAGPAVVARPQSLDVACAPPFGLPFGSLCPLRSHSHNPCHSWEQVTPRQSRQRSPSNPQTSCLAKRGVGVAIRGNEFHGKIRIPRI